MEAGCFNEGRIYYTGNGAARDVAKAKTLFEKACKLGQKEGCSNVEAIRLQEEKQAGRDAERAAQKDRAELLKSAVDISKLYRAFNDNETAAGDKYDGPIVVHASVLRIEDLRALGAVLLRTPDSVSPGHAFVKEESIEDAKKLRPGSTVIMKCRQVDLFQGDLRFEDCEIADAQVRQIESTSAKRISPDNSLYRDIASCEAMSSLPGSCNCAVQTGVSPFCCSCIFNCTQNFTLGSAPYQSCISRCSGANRKGGGPDCR